MIVEYLQLQPFQSFAALLVSLTRFSRRRQRSHKREAVSSHAAVCFLRLLRQESGNSSHVFRFKKVGVTLSVPNTMSESQWKVERTSLGIDPRERTRVPRKKSFGSNELSLNAPGARSYPVSPPGLSNRYRSHCPVFIVLIFIVIPCGQIQGHVAAAFLVVFPEIPLDDVGYTSDSTSSASRFDTH